VAEIRDRPLVFVKLHAEQKTGTKGPKAPKGEPLDISDKIISFRFDDEERKADRIEITLDNHDLAEFDNPTWKQGGVLEVTWGYPGQMSPARFGVIEKVSGGRELRVEARGLEMLMHRAKTIKVYQNKTLYQLVQEVASKYQDVMRGYADVDREAAADAKAGGFDGWYAQVAARKGLDANPDAKKHFYDFRALYHDMIAGKVTYSTDNLPDQYRRGAPSNWVRNEAGGPLLDARTGRLITDAEVDKVQVAQTDSLAANISPAAKKIKLAYASQSAETDAQLVSKYARKYGFVFYIDNKGVHFKSRDDVYKQKPAKVLTWFNGESEWYDFTYHSDSGDKSAKVTEKGVDPLNKKKIEQVAGNEETQRAGLGGRVHDFVPITGEQVLTDKVPQAYRDGQKRAEEAKSKSGGFLDSLKEMLSKTGQAESTDISHFSGTDPQLAKAKADGKYTKRQRHKHELSGTIVGDPSFAAKTVLEVVGLGLRLSGRWALRRVSHKIDSSGYVCDFEADRDGDNGFGQKGDHNSKAKLPDVTKTALEPARAWNPISGQFVMTTRNPTGRTE
jgi:phage protein D